MTTKAERDLEEELGPSPWPMYADEDEPWKDLDRLVTLDEKFDYQYEIAHVLGCPESRVSYWMGKAKDHARREAMKTGAICERCEEAEVPGGSASGNRQCDDCVDEMRRRDREADYGDDYFGHLEALDA